MNTAIDYIPRSNINQSQIQQQQAIRATYPPRLQLPEVTTEVGEQL